MMIDVTPLIPYLDAFNKAVADLASSDAEFAALTQSEQHAQVNHYLTRDAATEVSRDEACKRLIAELNAAVSSYIKDEP